MHNHRRRRRHPRQHRHALPPTRPRHSQKQPYSRSRRSDIRAKQADAAPSCHRSRGAKNSTPPAKSGDAALPSMLRGSPLARDLQMPARAVVPQPACHPWWLSVVTTTPTNPGAGPRSKASTPRISRATTSATPPRPRDRRPGFSRTFARRSTADAPPPTWPGHRKETPSDGRRGQGRQLLLLSRTKVRSSSAQELAATPPLVTAPPPLLQEPAARRPWRGSCATRRGGTPPCGPAELHGGGDSGWG